MRSFQKNITIFAPDTKTNMTEILRNIAAFSSTFIVIATGTMILLQGCIFLFSRKKTLSDRQKRIVVYAGIALAVFLIPFYYFPC